MIRFKGMDFVIPISPENSICIISAWRQPLIKQQENQVFVALDLQLNNLVYQIKALQVDTVDLESPEEIIKTKTACLPLAQAIAQVVRDVAHQEKVYDGFPVERKQQLFWLSWNIMFYEQLANYLFDIKVSVPPLRLNLTENEELVSRYVRNQIYGIQYIDIIEDDFSTHSQTAEIYLESVNDSIDVLCSLLEHFDFVNELIQLYVERVRILNGLGRCQEAGETNEQAKAVLEKHQGEAVYLKFLEQVSV